MIRFVEGDLLKSGADALVNAINTEGRMGKGIALQFRQKYPLMFAAYQAACGRRDIQIGTIWPYRDASGVWIFGFPTKTHWLPPSRIEYIERAMPDLIAQVERLGIRSIAIPRLGCGSGGLKWETVWPVMRPHLERLPPEIDVQIFA